MDRRRMLAEVCRRLARALAPWAAADGLVGGLTGRRQPPPEKAACFPAGKEEPAPTIAKSIPQEEELWK